MNPTNRRILLKSRPEGPVTADNFELDEQAGQSTVTRSRRDDVYRILNRLSAPLGTNISWDADEAQIRVELP